MSVSEAAKRLKVSECRIRALIRRGPLFGDYRLNADRDINGHYRIDEASVEAFERRPPGRPRKGGAA
jgi:excisionase family DNA binding protein